MIIYLPDLRPSAAQAPLRLASGKQRLLRQRRPLLGRHVATTPEVWVDIIMNYHQASKATLLIMVDHVCSYCWELAATLRTSLTHISPLCVCLFHMFLQHPRPAQPAPCLECRQHSHLTMMPASKEKLQPDLLKFTPPKV